MSNVKIQLRFPEDLRDAAMWQAAKSGMSMNLFVANRVAVRVGARAEEERYFFARGSRTMPGQSKALLTRLGNAEAARDGDHFDAGDDLSGD